MRTHSVGDHVECGFKLEKEDVQIEKSILKAFKKIGEYSNVLVSEFYLKNCFLPFYKF